MFHYSQLTPVLPFNPYDDAHNVPNKFANAGDKSGINGVNH